MLLHQCPGWSRTALCQEPSSWQVSTMRTVGIRICVRKQLFLGCIAVWVLEILRPYMPIKLHLSGVVCTTVELLKKSDCLVEIWRGASSLPAKSRRRPRCCTNPFSRTVWQTLGISGRFCWQIDKRGSSRCCQYASYGYGAVPCSWTVLHRWPWCFEHIYRPWESKQPFLGAFLMNIRVGRC